MGNVSRRFQSFFAALMLALTLAACNGTIAGHGVSPVLDGADVKISTANYIEVRDTFFARAGLVAPLTDGRDVWRRFMTAGFSYVDEKCRVFVDDLFEADRLIRAGRNQLGDIATAATAILALTQASRAEVGVVAAALGLATKSLDNYALARLANIGPERIRTLLQRSTTTYREAVLANLARYSDQTAAMDAIAGYLDLCRIPTIIAQVDSIVQDVRFERDPGWEGRSIPSLRAFGGGSGARVTPRREAEFVPRDPERGRVPRPPSVPGPSGLLTDFERRVLISAEQVVRLQKALCVSDTSVMGDKTSPTRIAILQFEWAWKEFNQEAGRSITADGAIDNQTLYDEITTGARKARCDAAQERYGNLYERVRFPSREAVMTMQKRLFGALKEIAVPADVEETVFASGVFDTRIREAIRAVQRAPDAAAQGGSGVAQRRGPSASGMLDPATYRKIRQLSDRSDP